MCIIIYTYIYIHLFGGDIGLFLAGYFYVNLVSCWTLTGTLTTSTHPATHYNTLHHRRNSEKQSPNDENIVVTHYSTLQQTDTNIHTRTLQLTCARRMFISDHPYVCIYVYVYHVYVYVCTHIADLQALESPIPSTIFELLDLKSSCHMR